MKYVLVGDSNAIMFESTAELSVSFKEPDLLSSTEDSEELRAFLRLHGGTNSVLITSVNDHHHIRSWRELSSWPEQNVERYSQECARQLYARLANWQNVYGFFSVILHGSAPANFKEHLDLGAAAPAGGADTRNRIIHSFDRAFIHWAESDPSPVYFASNFYAHIHPDSMFGDVEVHQVNKNQCGPNSRDFSWEHMILPCAQHHERVRVARKFYNSLADRQYAVSVEWTPRGIRYGSWTHAEHCFGDHVERIDLLNQTWSWQGADEANPEIFQELCVATV